MIPNPPGLGAGYPGLPGNGQDRDTYSGNVEGRLQKCIQWPKCGEITWIPEKTFFFEK